MIGVLGLDFRRGLEIFLFTTASRTALGPTQPSIQCVSEVLSLGREANHSPPSSADIKECVELYLHFPNTPSWRGAQLKHREELYLLYQFSWLAVGRRTDNKAVNDSENKLHVLCWNDSWVGQDLEGRGSGICSQGIMTTKKISVIIGSPIKIRTGSIPIARQPSL
jgi:hypothetical protein